MRTEFGMPFRVERDSEWQVIDILKLTREELIKDVLADQGRYFSASLVMMLVNGLKEAYEKEATQYTELRDWESQYGEAARNLERIKQAIDALDIW